MISRNGSGAHALRTGESPQAMGSIPMTSASTRGRLLYVSALLLATLGAVGATLYESPGGADRRATHKRGPRAVQVAVATHRTMPQRVRAHGMTRSRKRAVLTFQVAGRLRSRPVSIGDRVGAGQLVALLSSPTLEPTLHAAKARAQELKARLSQRRRDLRRLRALRERDATSAQALDQAEAEVRALSASLENARARLSRARRRFEEIRLVAPFRGEVGHVYAEPGEYVTPGQPVVRVSQPEKLEVMVELPGRIQDYLKVGDAVAVTFPLSDGLSSDGRIRELGADASTRSGRFPAVIDVEASSGIRAGMAAQVEFTLQRPPQLSVPSSAVVAPGSGSPVVFRLTPDSTIQRVSVDVGRLSGDHVAITGDIAPGDRVVTTGHSALVDGQKVRVRREP